ncbi:MAG TPA: hypothetical protein VFF10_07725 [Trueperaceae bacterium]|nr:hypothetical protein [Trueperaceae bacterium]
MRRGTIVVLLVALAVLLAGCRNETQNRIRRSIQDFTATRMYITIYSYDGKEVFSSVVDGKVTRSGTASEGSAGDAQGAYIFWYDERGRYHQTDLPYVLTSYDINEELPPAPQ